MPLPGILWGEGCLIIVGAPGGPGPRIARRDAHDQDAVRSARPHRSTCAREG